MKRDEAMSPTRLRDQAKGDIKIDSSYVEEARTDGGTGSPTDEEDEYRRSCARDSNERPRSWALPTTRLNSTTA